MTLRRPPSLQSLLRISAADNKPTAIVLAGNNGSGKSTLWYDQLADGLQIPLVNADRLTLSLLPIPDPNLKLRPWAARLRDQDERWQKLSQDGVQLFMGLIMDQSCCARWSVSLHTPFQMNLSVEQFPMMPSLRPTMTTLSVG